MVSLHLPLDIYNTRRVQNLACSYVSLQVVCPDTRCKHHSETICPCVYCSRQKTQKIYRCLSVLGERNAYRAKKLQWYLIKFVLTGKKRSSLCTWLKSYPGLNILKLSPCPDVCSFKYYQRWLNRNDKASMFILKCNHVHCFGPSTNDCTKLTATTREKDWFVLTYPLSPLNIACIIWEELTNFLSLINRRLKREVKK